MAVIKMSVLIFLLLTFGFSSVFGPKPVVELHEDNWRLIMKGEWMVKFYAPWCPACKSLQPTWKEFAARAEINVGQVDVTTSPGLSGRFMVTALPTIFHVLDGQFRHYTGPKDKEAFLNFITQELWKKVESVPSWKSPDSIQMSIVSSFFKFSQVLRTAHDYFMEEYGLPTWGSYLIFAVATIILGALLGLVLVCIIDLIYPPRVSGAAKHGGDADVKKTDKIQDDELADEEIKDDLLDDASQSDGEQVNNQESGDVKTSPPSSPSVKKRKPRKAD